MWSKVKSESAKLKQEYQHGQQSDQSRFQFYLFSSFNSAERKKTSFVINYITITTEKAGMQRRNCFQVKQIENSLAFQWQLTREMYIFHWFMF